MSPLLSKELFAVAPGCLSVWPSRLCSKNHMAKLLVVKTSLRRTRLQQIQDQSSKLDILYRSPLNKTCMSLIIRKDFRKLRTKKVCKNPNISNTLRHDKRSRCKNLTNPSSEESIMFQEKQYSAIRFFFWHYSVKQRTFTKGFMGIRAEIQKTNRISLWSSYT